MSESQYGTSNARERFIQKRIIKRLAKAGIKDGHRVKYGWSLLVGEYVRIEAGGYTQYASGFDPNLFEKAVDEAVKEIIKKYIRRWGSYI